MTKNKMDDLRDHLFETLEKVKDGDMKIETAEAIAHIAGVLVESAKVEVRFIQATQRAGGSPFLDPQARKQLPAPQGGERK